MATLLLVEQAIVALKDRTGSSSVAITKWIESEKKTEMKKHLLKAALKKGVDSGKLVQVKNSFKVSPEEKKKVVKSTATAAKAVEKKPKKVESKKPATKKVGKVVKKKTTVKKSPKKVVKIPLKKKSAPKAKKATAGIKKQ